MHVGAFLHCSNTCTMVFSSAAWFGIGACFYSSSFSMLPYFVTFSSLTPFWQSTIHFNERRLWLRSYLNRLLFNQELNYDNTLNSMQSRNYYVEFGHRQTLVLAYLALHCLQPPLWMHVMLPVLRENGQPRFSNSWRGKTFYTIFECARFSLTDQRKRKKSM